MCVSEEHFIDLCVVILIVHFVLQKKKKKKKERKKEIVQFVGVQILWTNSSFESSEKMGEKEN